MRHSDLDKLLDEVLQLEEKLQLIDVSDDILGNYYNAFTEEDLINSLDEMIIGDTTGCILQSRFDNNLFAELTLNRVESDLYTAVFETEDEQRESTYPLFKEEMIEFLKDILNDYQVSSFEYRREILYDN